MEKKRKKEKNLKKQEIQNMLIYFENIKTNKINLAFNVICFKNILRIYPEEQPLIKYNVREYLKIQNMMDIIEVLFLWLLHF